MKYHKLGRTDLDVSALCLGTMQFGWSADEAASQRVLSAAYEAGVNFIDTADIYTSWVAGNPGGVSEQIIGRWRIRAQIPRDRLVIATKVRGKMWSDADGEGLSRDHIMKAVEASLHRLQIDNIDLYQTHWSDKNVPIEETLQAFDDLVHQGKVRYIGCSNYTAEELHESLDLSSKNDLVRFETLQPHYNLIHRAEFEEKLAGLCRDHGLGVIPYSPLAGGFLTGKYRKGMPVPDSVRAGSLSHALNDKNFVLIDKMDAIARDKNATIAQVALAWMMADPLVTSPIIGANSITQLNENLGALEVKLTAEEKLILDQTTAWQVIG